LVRVFVGKSDVPGAQSKAIAQALRLQPWQLIVTTTHGVSRQTLALEHKIPVLFRTADDPVKSCLVSSKRRPGGNGTGYSSDMPDEAKMIELLRLAYPVHDDIVILVDGVSAGGNDCGRSAPEKPLEATAPVTCLPGFWRPALEEWRVGSSETTDYRSLLRQQQGLPGRVRVLRLCSAADVSRLADWLPSGGRVGLVLPMHQLFYEAQDRLVASLHRLRLPSVTSQPWLLGRGVVLNLQTTAPPEGRPRGVELASRLLLGTPPGEIPVMVPEGFEFTIDTAAARDIGLPPSRSALKAADRLLR
jgi:ABC-type uncharacterized transport system substrate-binding protein